MYKLFTDKLENFECTLKLEGTSVSKSLCRLILESPEWNLLFMGEISSDGNVKIPIKKLKNILSEGTEGKIKLEVIADQDTYFMPWEDTFKILTEKKVVVESIKPQNTIQSKPKVTLVKEDITKDFGLYLNNNNITINNISKNKNRLNSLMESYVKQHKVSDNDFNYLINNIYKCLNYMK